MRQVTYPLCYEREHSAPLKDPPPTARVPQHQSGALAFPLIVAVASKLDSVVASKSGLFYVEFLEVAHSVQYEE